MNRRTYLATVCAGATLLPGCASFDGSAPYDAYVANTDEVGHVVDVAISDPGNTLWEERRWFAASEHRTYDDVFSMGPDDDWAFEAVVTVDDEDAHSGFYRNTIDTFGIVVQGPSTVTFPGSDRAETPRPSPTPTVDEGSPTATANRSG